MRANIALMLLSKYLAESDLTQQGFALRVGVTQGRISQILAGHGASPALAARIEQATGGKVRKESLVWPSRTKGRAARGSWRRRKAA